MRARPALLALAAVALLTGCPGDPTPIHHDECGCSMTLIPRLRPSPEAGADMIAGYGNDFVELYVAIDALRYAEGEEPLRLDEVIEIVTAEDSDEALVGEPSRFEVSGRPALSFDTRFSIDGAEVQLRHVFVDAGDRMVELRLWTRSEDWAQNLRSIETMVSSLRLDEDPAGT